MADCGAVPFVGGGLGAGAGVGLLCGAGAWVGAPIPMEGGAAPGPVGLVVGEDDMVGGTLEWLGHMPGPFSGSEVGGPDGAAVGASYARIFS